MRTISMIFVCTILSIAIGIPIGILMSRSDRLQRMVNPVLDVMQTMPSFVYLIPVVMLLGIGSVPGLIAVVIYAIPPMIRLTNLGIRLVDKDVLEAADAFGSSSWQKLEKRADYLSRFRRSWLESTRRIMMALAMVVIASMIGVQGLGQPVLQGNREPVLHTRYFQRPCHRRHRHHLRPRQPGLWTASAEAPGGRPWLISASTESKSGTSTRSSARTALHYVEAVQQRAVKDRTERKARTCPWSAKTSTSRCLPAASR